MENAKIIMDLSRQRVPADNYELTEAEKGLKCS